MNKINTKIWKEVPHPENDFVTNKILCHGYDLHKTLMGKISISQMIFLLFKGELPSGQEDQLLTNLFVTICNPGPRDPSVHAAMCGGVGESLSAASLMAYLAVGAGQVNGSRELYLIMEQMNTCKFDIEKWEEKIINFEELPDDIWAQQECAFGFELYHEEKSEIIEKLLNNFNNIKKDGMIDFLNKNRAELELVAKKPFNIHMISAAVFHDLGFSSDQGEMIHLWIRMLGAAVHTLEQQKDYGFKKFPFYQINIENDPGAKK